MSITTGCVFAVLSAFAAFDDEPAPKVNPPGEAEEKAANEVLDDFYAGDIAKARQPQQKSALARTLLDQADKSKKDAAAYYCLLKRATMLASDAGDAALAVGTIDRMSGAFHVDALKIRTRLLPGLAKNTTTKPQAAYLAAETLTWIEDYTRQNDWQSAKEIVTVAAALAKKAGDTPSQRSATEWNKEIQRGAKSAADADAAKVVLESSPSDPASNLLLGRHLCFFLDDWNKGLPYLALAGKSELEKAVLQDLQPRADHVAAAKLWQEAAAEEKDEYARRGMRQRAAWHLEQSVAGVDGLARKKVEKELVRFSTDYPELFFRREVRISRDLTSGWSHHDFNLFYAAEIMGRRNLWRTHPLSTEKPFRWERYVALPEKIPCGITFNVIPGTSPVGDFKLQVVVEGKTLVEKIISQKAWQPIAADLGPFAGKEVKIQLIQSNGGGTHWNDEHCHWDNVRIVPRN